jgi:hypothetical protein
VAEDLVNLSVDLHAGVPSWQAGVAADSSKSV